MTKLYLDTNIYLDNYYNRNDHFRPLGEFSFQLIKRALNGEFHIVYSREILNELCKVTELDYTNCKKIFFHALSIKNRLIFTELKENYRKQIKKYITNYGIPRTDTIHLLLSIQEKAILITRDYHLLHHSDEFDILRPEDLQ